MVEWIVSVPSRFKPALFVAVGTIVPGSLFNNAGCECAIL